MPKYHVEKNGWRVAVGHGGQCHWVEHSPTYTKKCTSCGGVGTVSNDHCSHREDGDFMGFGCGCIIACGCKMVNGVGHEKDEPKHQMPSVDILIKLENELSKTMKQYGIRLNEGFVEMEIAKEKALNASAQGANL